MRFQILTAMQNSVMLNLRGNNMAAFAAAGFIYRFKRPVIRFGTASRKVNLIGLCSQCHGNGLPGRNKRSFTLASQSVYAAGIAIIFTKIRQHRFHHPRSRPGGRRIVKIYHKLRLPFMIFHVEKRSAQ